MKTTRGSFLIAKPSLADPNFVRTVVYMVEHNTDGAFGLVLTRPIQLCIWDICQKIIEDAEFLSCREYLEKIPALSGGPVQTSTVFFLHNLMEFGEESNTGGAVFGHQLEDLKKVLQGFHLHDSPQFRLFLGYSGWGPGQLEKELAIGGWLVRPAKLEEIFAFPTDKLWGSLLKSFGGEYSLFADMPSNPQMN